MQREIELQEQKKFNSQKGIIITNIDKCWIRRPNNGDGVLFLGKECFGATDFVTNLVAS
jgi:hypothetical protein